MSNSCPICFEELIDKSRASPDICDHIFCLPCLEKWSKYGSYCPVDRKRFKKIVSLDSETAIQVKPLKPKQQRVLYDVTVYCEVCKKHNSSGTLLLCDCCDLGYHCKCLTPPLKEVPAGQWYCPVCAAVEIRIKTTKGYTKEVQYRVENATKSEGTHDRTDNFQNNYVPDSQTTISKNEVCVANIPEPSLKVTVVSNNSNLKNEKEIDYCQNFQCNQMTNSTNQSNIVRSERNSACSQEHHGTKKELMSMSIWNKINKNHSDFLGKAIENFDNFSTAQNSIASETCIQNKKEQHAKKRTKSTRLCRKDDRKLRNCIRETIDFGDDSPVIQNDIVRSILNRKEQPIEKEIDVEDSSSTVKSSIARNEKSISGMTEHANKDTGLTGLSRENHRKLKNCLRDSIDLGADSPGIQNSIARCIQNRKEQHIKKELTDLSKKVNKKLKDCNIETINIKDDYSSNQNNFERSGRSYPNILKECFKTPIESTSFKTMGEKISENFEGEKLYFANISPANSSNTAKSNKKSFNKLEKMEIVSDHLKKDCSNRRNCHSGTTDKGSYCPEKQSNAAKSEGSIHDSQEEGSMLTKKEVLSSLRPEIKRSTRDQPREAISFKNNSNKHSISRNENILSQKQSKKMIELIIQSKGENVSKHSDIKDVDNLDSPVFQTNIAISQNSIQKNHEQHREKKNVQTYLIKLKDSLTEELEEHYSKTKNDSCIFGLKTPHCNASLASDMFCFKKKDMKNYSDTPNLYFTSEKNKVESQRKSSDSKYLIKKQKKISSKESKKMDQQQVQMKNMPLLASSPLNTTLSYNDQVSLNVFQSRNTLIKNSHDINNSSKDNFNRNFTSCQFSVFETLEDTLVSSQRYLNINRAVKEMDHTTDDSLSLVSKNFPTPTKFNSISSENINSLLKNLKSQKISGKSNNLNKTSDCNADFIHNPLEKYNVRQVKYAIRAKMNLAEELKKIEREKWPSSLKKQKRPRLYHSAIPKKLQKDLYNFPSASVCKQVQTYM